MGFRHYVKWGFLALVLCVGVWLLWPVSEESTNGADAVQEEARADARYVIKFSPGVQYMPGTVPYGIGEPLEGLAEVISEFEARFPDTRVELVLVPGVREYIVTQLSSGRAPDIINVNVEDVWIDVQKGWYVALDPYLEAPNPFIREKNDPSLPGYNQWWDMFKYQAISRGKAAPDNRNYCISFDMIETGIFYNKRIFAEAGVEVPSTWSEWISVMARIKEKGHVPLLMSIDGFNDWCTDLLFDQLYYNTLPGIDLYQDPVREAYLEGYLDWDELTFLYGKGFFQRGDIRYETLWKLMYQLRQYCNDNLAATDFLREFVTQHGAMIWSTSLTTYRLIADHALGFEWGVFYLPPLTKEDTPFASETPMCVIGGSGTQLEVTNSSYDDTGEPATSVKLQRVMALLQFLCVPENYERVVNEYACLLPNINGVPVLPSLEPFDRILERRYTTTKWVFTFDLKFSEIQRRMLELYLNDGIDLDDFLGWQKRNLDAATSNLLQRKDIDLERLRKVWEKQEPVRVTMEGLPDAP